MDILMLGNGFDLAHGLPTKYTDFLEFVMVMHQVVDNGVPNDKIDYGKLSPELIELIKAKIDSANKDEWKNLIYDNFWIKYFQRNPLYQKENWIDFETEMSRVIKQLDSDMLYAEGQKYELTDAMVKLSNEFLSQIYSKYTFVAQSVDAFTNGKSETITFKEIRDRLYQDLNKLIRALELYLSDFVEHLECKLMSSDIKEIAIKKIEHTDGTSAAIISKIICFNYTNTYARIYVKEELLKNYIDYIHGKSDSSNTIESNNMVLGIDEYLPDDRKNKEVEFIAFKKFYQRIHKGTGCKYKDWVGNIQEEYEAYLQRKAEAIERENRYISDSMQRMMTRLATSAIKDEKCKKHNFYIFGHSLDVTDGDILKDLILNDNVYTTIYYLNKEVMGQQIANLVKVIGQDELVRRTGGSTKSIEFKQQAKMVVE
ncbi:MAG: bacteriophage abortive infection AbiH family protein [Candidatus Galacturonibacter soehngenii]|nr:bacteriophage abortive infection AbiH family protein [Candidatus Galacturonibacter soehngenii]